MKVLVAEDDRASRVVLEKYLEKWGYEVVSAKNGLEAWEVMKHDDCPRIAILDWMMPEMSGVEVCRRIRERKGFPYAYVILLTAKNQREDVAEGYETGVDDYAVKPFDPIQLQQRLTVGVRVAAYESELSESKKQLERYASEMEALAEERARQLVHAERMATLGLLSAGIAHEINNPVTYISGNAELLERLWPEITEKLEKDRENDGQVEYILERRPNSWRASKRG
jgi:DNA-binding response OmpR family regulator